MAVHEELRSLMTCRIGPGFLVWVSGFEASAATRRQELRLAGDLGDGMPVPQDARAQRPRCPP